MRILALSEIPQAWTDHVARWRALNERLATVAGDKRCPSAGHEYLLYQALIGAWCDATPSEGFVRRIEAYAIKAAREGKQETSWITPDEVYERNLRAFVQAILDPERAGEFLAAFAAFARRTALLGALNSMSQLTLKATMPGVPDFYQGTEFWDLSLVDPDNRRPVDFDARQRQMSEASEWPELVDNWADGRIKFVLTRRLLQLRRDHPALFQAGSYEPVIASGPDQDDVVAFLRRSGRSRVLVAVGRHFARHTRNGTQWLRGGWQAKLDVANAADFRDALADTGATREAPRLAELFATLPVSVLIDDH